MARIYISSTYKDLKEYREVVYRTLRQMGHDAIAMEDYVATDARPVDKCLEDVAACELYVGIFAFAYGYVPETANPEGRSITELEYRKAGDVGIPRLIFLVKQGASWPTSMIDALVGTDGRRIDELRKELERRHTDSFFETAEELARKVSVSVPKELQRTRLQINVEAPRQRFIDHMRSFAGARSEQDAFKRYVTLRLQATRASRGGFKLPAGTWTDLVEYPARVVLTGEAGSGKTTLLLHEAARLAGAREMPDVPLPLYLSLKTFTGGDADTLLELVALANQIDAKALRELWSEPRRPVCLFLDGGDETMHRDELIEAVIELARMLDAPNSSSNAPSVEPRSLVVACHPGPFQDRMAALQPVWNEFLLLALRRADIDAMLTRFDAAALIPALDNRLQQVVRRPDLLAALAQSAREASIHSLPRNAAEIYGLYFQHIFSKVGGGYEYERIKRPVLAHLAYDMLRNDRLGVACDDPLYDWMAGFLEDLDRRYRRRRRVMPHDWSAEGLHDELLRSPIVDTAVGRDEMLTFSKALYRDYFAAVQLASSGASSQQARDLVPILVRTGHLNPLSFVLGMDPDAAMLLDTLPPESAAATAQIWLEDRPKDRPVPDSILTAYHARRGNIRAGTLDARLPFGSGDRPSLQADPRRRLKVVSELVSQTPLPHPELLRAADDDHPLVRAVAQHALLHAGSPRAKLDVACEDGSFRWRSYGSGTAVVGPLTLLRVPVVMAIDLAITIDALDFDPFTVDCEFSFMPLSSALFAADLFGAPTGVDWLELLGRLQEIAQVSTALACRTSTQPGLTSFGDRLARRATHYAGVGRLLAADLGLPWEELHLPETETDDTTAKDTYRILRSLFSAENQAQTLRLGHLAQDQVLTVSMSSDRVAGELVGIQIDRIDSRGDDDGEASQFAFITGSRTVATVEAGTVCGVDVGHVRASARELPLTVHISDSTHVSNAVGADLSAIRLRRLRGAACPWRVQASFHVDRFVNSHLRGVVVEKYKG